jgi:Zn-finger nucleic acid-binding protein
MVCERDLVVVQKNGCDHTMCPRMVEVVVDSAEDEALLTRWFTIEGRRISFADTQPLPLSFDTDPATLLSSLGGLDDLDESI